MGSRHRVPQVTLATKRNIPNTLTAMSTRSNWFALQPSPLPSSPSSPQPQRHHPLIARIPTSRP
jgi:hypothetical protein